MDKDKSPSGLTRRAVAGGGLAFAAAGMLADTGVAQEMPPALAQVIADFGRGRTPDAAGVLLDIEDSVDDGSTVPVAVSVTSPMTESEFVEAVLVAAPDNPFVTVAEFRFTPASGEARVRTRMRLAKSQTVVALARLNDGRLLMARKAVAVVANGCVG